MTTSDLDRRLAGLTPERRALVERRLRQPRIRETSVTQQGLWFLDQLLPGSPLYTIALRFRLAGPVDLAALESAARGVVARHEALRTTFALHEGGPVQRVASRVDVPFDVVDLRAVPAPDRLAAAIAETERAAAVPFDLERGPLVRFVAARLADDDTILLLLVHHIVFDLGSTEIFVRELADGYVAALDPAVPAPPSPPLQYGDFAVWQRNHLTGDTLAGLVDFWRDRLAGMPGVTELPTDRARPAAQTYRGDVHRFAIPADVATALRGLAVTERATLFMVLLAGFRALLTRITGQPDLAVGTPVANRPRPELRSVIGFFINTVVLRTDLGDDPTARETISRVRDACAAAFEHQDLPFDQLVGALAPERSLAYNPLVQVTFAVDDEPGSRIRFGGLTLAGVDGVDTGLSKFDLSFTVTRAGDRLECTIDYGADLFDPETIAWIARRYVAVLTAIAADPDRAVSALPLLPDDERAWLRRAGNGPEVPYPAVSVVDLVARSVAERPDAVAVVAGGAALTYRELDERAGRLAAHLGAAGIGPDARVAIVLERSADLVVAILGVLRAGGAYVPLDPDLPPERLGFMLRDCGAPIVVTSDALARRLPGSAARMIRVDGDADAIGARPVAPAVPVGPRHLAYMIYTSGSTGRPKGVLIEHGSLTNLVLSNIDMFAITPADRVLQFASPTFDVAVWETFVALCSGAALHVHPRDDLVTPDRLAAVLRGDAITIADLPPAMIALLPPDGFPALRISITGLEAFSSDLVDRWAAPSRRFVNGYGPTEATVVMTWADCVAGRPGPPSIGGPAANNTVYVLDRTGAPAPIGVAGELYIGGAQVARGYHGRPALTAERFLPDPFGPPGGRLYRTGDMCRWLADGGLEYVGRADAQVKIRGFRVELGEVADAVARAVGARQAAVICREDRPGDKRLVAFVPTATPDTLPDVGDLRAALRGRLPDYMLPAALVAVDALPVSPSGKVDRAALALVAVPAPVRAAAATPGRTPTERVLCTLWADALGLDAIGADDDFFDLGGHSLLVAQVVATVNEAFGLALPVSTLFGAPTPAGFAAAVTGAAGGAAAADRQAAVIDEVLGLSDEHVVRRLRTGEANGSAG